MFAARQFVNHGHIKVNGKRVNIPCYRVKVGDVIEVRTSRAKQLALVLDATQLAERDVPEYVEVDHCQDDGQAPRASRSSPTCPTRSRWNRTWWSSIIRADLTRCTQFWLRNNSSPAEFFRG